MDFELAMAERVKRGTVKVPPSPVVALRLMQLMADEKASLLAIRTTLEKDQALAAVVLRLANSARYRWGREVTTIQQAIVVLGRRALREVSMSGELHDRTVTMGPLLSLRRRAWRESLTEAHVCGWLAPSFNLTPDDAFIVGLMNHIGRVPAIGLLEGLMKEYDAVDSDERWWRMVEARERELGVLLARTWALPHVVCDSIAQRPEAKRMLELLQVADEVVRLMDGEPRVTADHLGAIAMLSTEQCTLLADKLPLLPQTLDAFREPDNTHAPANVEDFELQVDDPSPTGRRVTLTHEGLITETAVKGMTADALTVAVSLTPGRLVKVHAGEARFHARVTSTDGSNSELRPWALDAEQSAEWKNFVESGFEDLYELDAAS